MRLSFWKRVPLPAIFFTLFLSIYLLGMSGTIQYGDEMEKYRVAQSIVERLDVSFRPTAMRNETGVGGRTYSVYEMGQTLLEVPLYALGKLAYTFFPQPDVNSITMLFVGLLNPIVTALTCVLLYETAATLGFAYPIPLLLTFLFGLCTVAWPYTKSYTREPLLTLFILLSVYAAFRFSQTARGRWALIAGIASGYLAFTKFIQAMIVPFVALYLAAAVYTRLKSHPTAFPSSHAQSRGGPEPVRRGDPERSPFLTWRASPSAAGSDYRRNLSVLGAAARPLTEALGLFFSPFILFLILQSLYSLVRFGTPFTGMGTKQNPLEWIWYIASQSQPLTALWGILFSPEKSIFLYSPPVLLGVVAWLWWRRRNPMEAWLILGLILIELISVISRFDWNGGAWWGPRYLVQITPLLILPLGALLERWIHPSFHPERASLVVTDSSEEPPGEPRTASHTREIVPAQSDRTGPVHGLHKLGLATLGSLAVLGALVQSVGVTSSDRDYMDTTGAGISLAGQLDFLRHGVFESLVGYLSPTNGAFQLNPFFLCAFFVVFVACTGIVWKALHPDQAVEQRRVAGLVLVILFALVEGVTFTFWVVAPYATVAASEADGKLVAGDSFLADGRRCEATMMYLMALARGTTLSNLARDRVNQLLPHAHGTSFTADELHNQVELTGKGTIASDGNVTLASDASLSITIQPPGDGTATAVSDFVSVSPNTRYQLFGWIKSVNIYGTGYATVMIYEDDGEWRQSRDTEAKAMDETHGWQPFWKDLTTLPTTRRVLVKVGLWKTYGTVWVDGLELGALPGAAFTPKQQCPQISKETGG